MRGQGKASAGSERVESTTLASKTHPRPLRSARTRAASATGSAQAGAEAAAQARLALPSRQSAEGEPGRQRPPRTASYPTPPNQRVSLACTLAPCAPSLAPSPAPPPSVSAPQALSSSSFCATLSSSPAGAAPTLCSPPNATMHLTTASSMTGSESLKYIFTFSFTRVFLMRKTGTS